jgi:hypothetical protein
MERINFKEKRNFSEIMNATFGFIKQEFSPMLKILLFTVAPVALLAGIFFHYLINFVIDMFQMFNNPEVSGGYIFKNLAINFGLTITSYVVATIMVSAVVFGYIKVYVDEGPDIDISLGKITKWLKWDFWRLLLAAIVLSFLGFFVQIFVNLLPLLGAFIYMFISVFVTAITYLIYMIMVYERNSFFRSFSRSFELITNFWWVSFGLVAVTMIIQWSLSLSVAAPSAVAYGVYIYHTVKSANEAVVHYSPFWQVIGAVFTALASIMVLMLQAITLTAMAFHYFNLVESKEGPGLMEQIDKIGTIRLTNEKVY